MNAKCRLIFPLIFACLLASACIPGLEAPPTPEPVTLRFAFVGSEIDYQDLVERFNEDYPWITIELVGLNNFQRGLDPLHAEFETSDVVRANAAFLEEDQLALARPLDEFLAADTEVNKEDIFPGLVEAAQLQGQQLALPAGIDPLVMFYENARFRIAKAAPPGPDYSLDGLVAAAQAVHNPDRDARSEGKYSIGFCTSPFGDDPFIIARLFGGDTFDRSTEPYTPTLNTQANVAALRWYASLWTDYQVAPPVDEDQYGTFSLMSSSSCGLWLQFYDLLGFFVNMTIDPHMLPLPRTGMPNSQPWFALWDGYFLTRNSPHPQEAWWWMRFLMSDQAGSTTLVPPLVSQIASEEFELREKPDKVAIARAMPPDMEFYALADRGSEYESAVNDLFIEAVRQVVMGEADAQTALDEAQRQAEELMLAEMP